MDNQQENSGIKITDIDMPFGSMVRFMVKWAIAAIPALVILMVIGAVVGALLAGFTGALISGVGKTSPQTFSSFLPADTATMAPSPAPVPSDPAWDVSESTNPIDDSPTVTLSLTASGPVSTSLGGPPTLTIRCKSNETEAYINWNNFLGSDAVDVTTRLGRNPASTRSWTLSTDSRAAFYPGSVTSFVKQLMTIDTMIARTTPYSESPVTATFIVRGLSEKVGALRKACRW